ncbi:MAG: carboxypeptidase regulatory-like domain-containing protein [Gemmatimonadaceae bacterium]|nr:carboxypeptidase regulatory-like domain-containing protein [Gemmatimonadaceae bacterium]
MVHRRVGGQRCWMAATLMLLAATLVPQRVWAQTVRGVVTRVGVPVPGVVVQLLDASTAAVVARTLTDDAGAYRVLAPRAGSYRLATRRVGFSPTLSALFPLAVGETRVEALALDGVAVRLDTVRVVSSKKFQRLNAKNRDVFAIWEQARNALLATEATLAQRTFSATVLLSRREVLREGGTALLGLSLVDIDSVTQPWASRSIDDLRRNGYVVVGNDDSTAYLAPGLDMLVSDEFADDHAFALFNTENDSTIGLAFVPAQPDRRLVQLEGKLFLDRATTELRRLEFRYTNVVEAVARAGAGGQMEFSRMRDGGWVIARWQIRMPSVARYGMASIRTGRPAQAMLGAIEVAAGDVFVARRVRDTLLAQPLPTVSGTVADSASGRVIPNARLRLRETGATAATDATGRFDFGAILPGQYTLLTNTPSLDSVGATSALLLPVTESLASLAVRVPSARRVLPMVCAMTADSMARLGRVGVVRGLVSRDSALIATPRDSATVQVVLQWRDSASGPTRTLRTASDETGRYRVCGAPMGTAISVRAELGALSSVVNNVTLDSTSPFGQADLQLVPLAPEQALIRGDVVDAAGIPIDNAAVELPQLGLTATTDARGRYVMPRVPVGRQLMTVRKLGYTPADAIVLTAAGTAIEQRHVLKTVTTLAEVKTTASREWVREFEEHRRIGLGQFLTREDLATRESQRLGDIMSTMRGTHMMRSGQTATYLAGSRNRPREGACYAHVWLDGNPMYLGREGEQLFNLNEILVMQTESIEYYAGPSELPAKYNKFNSKCGVLVVHSKRD